MFALTTLGTAVLATSLVLASAGAATAAPAQHETFVESWDGQQHLSAEENLCGHWAATLHEVRSGEYKLVQAPGGQSQDEFHVNGAVDGSVVLDPDDPALPTYTGSYREKVNAIVIGYDEEEGDLARLVHYRLRLPLTGSDGSALVIVMSGTLVVNAHGDLVSDRGSMTCA